MERIIITRHAGAVKWLRTRCRIEGRVLAHATEEDVRGNLVVGIVPFSLAALAERVVIIDMPGLTPEQRGRDLTPEEMDAAGAILVGYTVTRIGGSENEEEPAVPCSCCGRTVGLNVVECQKCSRDRYDMQHRPGGLDLGLYDDDRRGGNH